MKTRLSLALLLAGLTSAAVSQTFAASDAQPARSHPVGAVERNSSSTIVRGTLVIEVYQTLGAPAEKQGNDVWIYRHFNAGAAQARRDDCDTLVVSFANGRVCDLQLVNDRAVAVFAQRIETKKNAALFAVTSR